MALNGQDRDNIRIEVVQVQLISLNARRTAASQRVYWNNPHMIMERTMLEAQILELEKELGRLWE